LLAIGRAGAVMLLIGVFILGIIYQQVKSGVELEELTEISIILAGFIFIGIILMVQGIKVHGRRHGWFR